LGRAKARTKLDFISADVIRSSQCTARTKPHGYSFRKSTRATGL